MKLTDYIARLLKFYDEHGDMDCFYSSDDEGNAYHPVNHAGDLYYTLEPTSYNPEMYDLEDRMDYPNDEFTSVCIIN